MCLRATTSWNCGCRIARLRWTDFGKRRRQFTSRATEYDEPNAQFSVFLEDCIILFLCTTDQCADFLSGEVSRAEFSYLSGSCCGWGHRPNAITVGRN